MASSGSECVVSSGAAVVLAPAQQCVMGSPMQCDEEMPAPPQREMTDAPEHWAIFPIDHGHPSVPVTGDKYYTKLICLTCGIGEPLGAAILGQYEQCFFCKGEGICGLGGPDGFPMANSGCECYKPTVACGCYAKMFCCKFGVINPFAEGKPFVVVLAKEIA